MLPGTFSNAGAGFFGKKYTENWMFGYQLYLSGNFDDSIIENPENKTFLPEAKNNPERFEEINSGEPLFTGKLAVRNNKIGELGISYMKGIYNKFQEDGIVIDDKRRVSVFALDFNTTIPKTKTFITTEFAWIKVDVPASLFTTIWKQTVWWIFGYCSACFEKNHFRLGKCCPERSLQIRICRLECGNF